MFERQFPYKEEILSQNLKVSFHTSCRASYLLKENVHHLQTDNESLSSTGGSSASSGRTQINRYGFDIRSHCFICGKESTRKQPLTEIQQGTGESTRLKVLNASQDRGDDEIYTRMLAHTGQFAYDGKYHHSCYSHYISLRNVSAAKNKMQFTKDV